MAFRIAPKDEVKTKVVVEQLGDLGKKEKFDFVAIFRKLPASKVRELLEANKSGDMSEDDIILENQTGWEGVLDENGEAVPFNSESLSQLLEIVEARSALATSFWRVQSGDASRKN